MKTILLSILVPVYNESNCISYFYERIKTVMDALPCLSELVFVNDGSTDQTLSIIYGLQRQDKRIGCIDLSRNFGKEIAVSAGIDYIEGDTLVILDADLQDPPELIPEMLGEINKGYDDVYGCRLKRRGETWLKKVSSEFYYFCLEKFANIPVQRNTGDFRMFSHKAIKALREIKETTRNMKGIFSYIGFKKKAVYFERDPRYAGKTKWSYLNLLNLAIQGLTSFSLLPLRFVSLMGVIVSVIAFVYLAIVIIKACLFGDPVMGYPSMMSVILFIGGIILLALGVIGEYLGIIYQETKRRPVYFVKEYRKSGSLPALSN